MADDSKLHSHVASFPAWARRLPALALGAALALTQLAAADSRATLRQLGDDATHTLATAFYAGGGHWRMCLGTNCGTSNVDWAADSLTGALFLRQRAAHDESFLTIFRALEATEPHYRPCHAPQCTGWSDVPMWDAVAALRTYDVTHDAVALRNAQDAYDAVAQSDVYARGACPSIDYQRPHAESGGLKTLETDANAILAGVLLAERTHRPDALAAAQRRYEAVRAFFLDPQLPLYSVYVFDDGRTCTQLPHRFFASVNGLMIEAGVELARATHRDHYAREARATAHALRALDDDRGIFTDLQAENDVVEPLVVAMFALASDGDRFARDWIVRNAAAAVHARRGDGAYGRFFDGPPPPGVVTAWQSNGGLALAIAAAILAPETRVEPDDPWPSAQRSRVALATVPSTFRFTGSAIALFGTLGEHCCESGHARLEIDGRETVSRVGVWQNKSSAGQPIPDTVLFAWRWPASGTHELRFLPGDVNAKEGGTFLDIRDAAVVP